jgi:hypothetical protein
MGLMLAGLKTELLLAGLGRRIGALLGALFAGAS